MGDYQRIETDVPGLKLLFMGNGKLYKKDRSDNGISNNSGFSIKELGYIFSSVTGLLSIPYAKLKKIDVLNLYHLRLQSLVVAVVFKIINRHGIVFLKMDMAPEIINYYDANPNKLKSNLLNKMLALLFQNLKIDIITVETKALNDFYKNTHPVTKNYPNIYYLPDGIDLSTIPKNMPNYENREKIILHVARIGAYQKRSDIVLESFARIARQYESWQLVLIGQMHNDFRNYYNQFLIDNQDICQRISHIGFLDRQNLFNYYLKSKIIAMPSMFESFGLVALEGIAYGNVLIGSDITALRELTDGGKHGYLCPVDNIARFADTLDHMLSHEDEVEEKIINATKYVRENYDWRIICGDLNNILRTKLRQKN